MSPSVHRTPAALAALISLVLVAGACGSSSDSRAGQDTSTTGDTTTDDGSASAGEADSTGISSLFAEGALTSEPTVVDCTLENGTETTCYQLEFASLASTVDTEGPYCPATTSETGGIWVWTARIPGSMPSTASSGR